MRYIPALMLRSTTRALNIASAPNAAQREPEVQFQRALGLDSTVEQGFISVAGGLKTSEGAPRWFIPPLPALYAATGRPCS